MFGGRKREKPKQPDTEVLARIEVGKMSVEVRGLAPGGSTGSLVVTDGGKTTTVPLTLDDASVLRAGISKLQGEMRILVTQNISGKISADDDE